MLLQYLKPLTLVNMVYKPIHYYYYYLNMRSAYVNPIKRRAYLLQLLDIEKKLTIILYGHLQFAICVHLDLNYYV